ncbi:TonB family protein [Sphingomonas sp. NIBR02145]|uniref:TonB family protein n=1 Tax=Sphingomonas sp. NIBR02145 TaxID=3014784 RepID=UPI0022B5693B|nr:TonB family protein [Sphingomonas sp. NIBR02145]WHU03955.1 TonB family protein [Sphingomonas sp. NIBR02145]
MLILTLPALLAQQDVPEQDYGRSEMISTGASPLHSESWITDHDYPAEIRRKLGRRSVKVALAVGEQGQVGGCKVARSSGSRWLDRETCRLLLKRAVFTPAITPMGNLATEFRMIIHWPPKPGEPE